MSTSVLLVQERLDVKIKSRTNLFNWRGQFTPDFVDYILDSFSRDNYLVLDPFAGSGTVLHGCCGKHLEAIGYEINPAAYAMCKFFTFGNLPPAARHTFLAAVEEQLIESLGPFQNLPLLVENKDFRQRYSNLLAFAGEFTPKVATKEEKILIANTLLIAESRTRKDLATTLINAFEYLRRSVLALPYSGGRLEAQLSDARLVHEHGLMRADLILTSPPYINVFNYHQNNRAILEAMGWSPMRVAASEIGSNRKNRGNRFRTVVQYCLDMEQALVSFWQTLKADALMILVVGRESNVRRTPFLNGLIIKDIMNCLGCFSEIVNYERQFTNRFGLNIKEDIIVGRKSKGPFSKDVARAIALKHLKHALVKAAPEVREDIVDVIDSIQVIEPSPMFTKKDLFSNA